MRLIDTVMPSKNLLQEVKDRIVVEAGAIENQELATLHSGQNVKVKGAKNGVVVG
jgi:hypothetical protein